MSVNFRKDGSEALRFGPYTVDFAAHCLRKGEAKIPIQEQPFRILIALLGRPGAVVTREERPHARAHVAHALIHPDEEPGFANLQGAQVASLTPSLNLPEQ